MCNQEVNEEIADASYRLGRAQARLEALKNQALHNPELEEAVRVLTWTRRHPGSVTGYGDGTLECPEGWPEGVDPDLEMEGYVNPLFNMEGNQ